MYEKGLGDLTTGDIVDPLAAQQIESMSMNQWAPPNSGFDWSGFFQGVFPQLITTAGNVYSSVERDRANAMAVAAGLPRPYVSGAVTIKTNPYLWLAVGGVAMVTVMVILAASKRR